MTDTLSELEQIRENIEQQTKRLAELEAQYEQEQKAMSWNPNHSATPVKLYTEPFPSTEQLQQQVKWLQETLYKVGDFCEKKSKASRNAFSNRINAEMELTMKLAAFDALAANIKEALANTQGDKKLTTTEK